MQQVDLKVWKEQKAFRDWDYEKQQAHEQATKMLHKVPRPTGKQYLLWFLYTCVSAVVVAVIIWQTVEMVLDGFKKSFGW